MQQIHHRGNSSNSTESEYFVIIDGKTAELTAVWPPMPAQSRLTRCTLNQRSPPWIAMDATWGLLFRSPTMCSISGAKSA